MKLHIPVLITLGVMAVFGCVVFYASGMPLERNPYTAFFIVVWALITAVPSGVMAVWRDILELERDIAGKAQSVVRSSRDILEAGK